MKVILRSGVLYLRELIPGTKKYRYKTTKIKVDGAFWDSENEIVKKGFPNSGDNNAKLQKSIRHIKDSS